MSALTIDDVHRWIEAADQRWASDLQFRELRKGVQAVSNLYVHKRGQTSLSDRAADGRGKRAGFIVYYGGLHLLLVQAWLSGRTPPSLANVWDLGCGPGIVGAAVARWGGSQRVMAVDRIGRHLEVATWTGRQLGVRVQTRKADITQVVSAVHGPGLMVLGWVLNELDDSTRAGVVAVLRRQIRSGVGVLVFSPLSLRASPWWGRVVATLCEARPDAEAEEFRFQPELPQKLRDIDRATRLNHRTMGARVLYVPPLVTKPEARAEDVPR